MEDSAEGSFWVIPGIPMRVKPVYTCPLEKNEEEFNSAAKTPKSGESRMACPPAPKKRKTPARCNYGGRREYFTPPELETVFIRRAWRT